MTQAEKDVVKGGGISEDWKPARTRQIDSDGRWTLKRGKPSPYGGAARTLFAAQKRRFDLVIRTYG